MIGGSTLWTRWYQGPRPVIFNGCHLVNQRFVEVEWDSGAGLEAITTDLRRHDGRLVVDVREDDAGGDRPMILIRRTVRLNIDWFAVQREGMPFEIQDGLGRRLTCEQVEERLRGRPSYYPETR